MNNRDYVKRLERVKSWIEYRKRRLDSENEEMTNE